MIFWTAAAAAAALVLLIVLFLYRRQVRRLCRQMEFLKKHKTNLRLTSELPFSELNLLIDEINELLDQTRETQRNARSSEESLKETITNLSHDIRTPLTSLDGYFQLLVQSDSDEERQHYLSVIRSRITSLKEILEELFTYTRLQNDSWGLPLEKADFGKCTFDTVFSFYDDFRKKGVEPEIRFCEERIYVMGNEEAIRRTLQNIIRNALVHGKQRILLTMEKQDASVIFTCRNDVEKPEQIDITQVFQRFYKTDSARTNTSTGLGLSIAKGLVERMNGEIRAALTDGMFEITVTMKCI